MYILQAQTAGLADSIRMLLGGSDMPLLITTIKMHGPICDML